MGLSAGQQSRRRHREQTCGHGGKERVDGWRRRVEACTLLLRKQPASRRQLEDSGAQSQSWGQPGGRDGAGAGREVRGGGAYVYPW